MLIYSFRKRRVRAITPTVPKHTFFAEKERRSLCASRMQRLPRGLFKWRRRASSGKRPSGSAPAEAFLIWLQWDLIRSLGLGLCRRSPVKYCAAILKRGRGTQQLQEEDWLERNEVESAGREGWKGARWVRSFGMPQFLNGVVARVVWITQKCSSGRSCDQSTRPARPAGFSSRPRVCVLTARKCRKATWGSNVMVHGQQSSAGFFSWVCHSYLQYCRRDSSGYK